MPVTLEESAAGQWEFIVKRPLTIYEVAGIQEMLKTAYSAGITHCRLTRSG